MRYADAYKLTEIGKPELPPVLQPIKEKATPEQWQDILQGWNNAIVAAEQCQLTGIKGILDSYLEISYGVPDKVPDADFPFYRAMWKALDSEITRALNEKCQCNRRII